MAGGNHMIARPAMPDLLPALCAFGLVAAFYGSAGTPLRSITSRPSGFGSRSSWLSAAFSVRRGSIRARATLLRPALAVVLGVAALKLAAT
jgi:hypothetical protein